MKRVTIYVDEKVWDEIKECAWQEKVSVGNYLVRLYLGNLDLSGIKLIKNQENMPPEFNKVVDKMITEAPKSDIPKEKIKEAIKKHKVVSGSFDYFNPQLKKKGK